MEIKEKSVEVTLLDIKFKGQLKIKTLFAKIKIED